jgi:hypothetical protein
MTAFLSRERRMSLPALPPLSEVDYDAIAAAVMETARGRWFLAEYARRNRHADTGMLLTSLQRLENVVAGQGTLSGDAVRAALVDIARAIERTKSQIAAARPTSDSADRAGPGYEFESIPRAAEQATADVLAASEAIQDIGWILREQGVAEFQCESLEARANDIYSACAAQDLAAQRMRRVAQMLRLLEGRIDAMLAMCGGRATAAQRGEEAREPRDEVSPMARSHASERFTEHAAALAAKPRPRRPAGTSKAKAYDDDPLAALRALTSEEKIALFT